MDGKHLLFALPSNDVAWESGKPNNLPSAHGKFWHFVKMAARDETVDNQEDDSTKKKDKEYSVKIICLGDSAVGKSKCV